MSLSQRDQVLVDLESLTEEQLSLLRSVEDSWQPSDFLPDMTDKNWRDKVDELRRNAAGLSDEALVILVGNIVTEEALPSYQTWLNRSYSLTDETGASQNPWARWTRGWTAEENRHGDLLHKYLYLSGRVNMRAFEVTTHHLIRNGFDPRSNKDPYCAIVYVSFQERATKISHSNMAKLAEKCGDPALGKICAVISADEARHEEAYKRFFRRVVELDAESAVISFAHMMRQKIDMPARLMYDGAEEDLFNQFAVVAQRAGIYTLKDYAEVLKHLLDFWGIPSLKGLSGEASQAQEYLCGLPDQYFAKTDRIREALLTFPKNPFSWIFGRSA